MTRAELIEKAKAWLTKNHPLAPAAEHQVARYADFALAVLEEERGKTKEEVAFLRNELRKSGYRFADPHAAEEASRGRA